MKKIIFLPILALCAMLFSCQSDEEELSNVGYLSLSVKQDVSTDTKALPADGYTGKQIGVQILNSKNAVVKETENWEEWKGAAIELPVGTYTIKAASTGFDGTEAAFSAPYYTASKHVSITNKENVNETLTCTLANVKVTVNYSDELVKAFKSVSSTVTGSGATLTFPTTETRSAYFPVGDLTAGIAIINNLGNSYSKVTSITDVKARDHYILNYKFEDTGNGNVTVKVDPTMQKYEYTFIIGKAEYYARLTANAWSTFVELSATDISGMSADMSPKFQYRNQGDDAWIDVAASGTTDAGYTAKITGLTSATTYEYQFVATSGETDQTFGNQGTFTTETMLELQNGGFEDWYQDGKIWYVASESIYKAGTYMWDTSNPGGGSFGYNPTLSESSIKHSGNYSAKLESTYAVVKFAAASLYYGRFNTLKGMSGAKIDFGQKFASRPTALHGYYQYAPATIDYVGSNQPANTVAKGDVDICSIYIAVSKKQYTVDNTDTSTFIDFENDDNIIAYGELPASDCVNTNGELKEFTIPLKYKNTKDKASYLIIVCSSSKYGDYFTGGKGSTLYLDDFELQYGDEPTMWN